jgi:histone-lysine N-methyltransferase SUV39H
VSTASFAEATRALNVDLYSRVYDDFGRTYLLNIDFQHLASNRNTPDYAVDAFHAGNVRYFHHFMRVLHIDDLLQFTRFLNHSCRPNLHLTALYVEDPDIRKPWLTLFCDRDIQPGEELTFSYTGMDVDDPEASRTRLLCPGYY